MRAAKITCLLMSLSLGPLGIGVPTASAAGLSPDPAKKIVQSVDADKDRLETIFKDLHQNPELGCMETRTAGIVAKELESLGYDVKTGIARTGVVGILRNGAGPTVMFRTDMDANDVEEASGLPYASRARVKMPHGSESSVGHVCGHDAHTTWLVSFARSMAGLKDD